MFKKLEETIHMYMKGILHIWFILRCQTRGAAYLQVLLIHWCFWYIVRHWHIGYDSSVTIFQWGNILSQYGLGSRKQPPPVIDYIGLLFWVVAYRRFNCILFLSNFQDFHSLAVEIAESCENLVFEQKLQQKGWAAVVANLESTARYSKRNCILLF